MSISGCSSNLPHGLLDSAYITHKVPLDYIKTLHLGKSGRGDTSENNKFDFLYSTQSKFRNPISCFTYEKKYFLQIYKMDSLTERSLEKNIEETYTVFDNTTSTPYSLDNTSSIEYLFKLTKPARPLKIWLKMNGTNNKILIKNDTMAYYFSKLKCFALTYNPEDVFDIIGGTKEAGSREYIDQELLFLRRNNNLYFLTMCPKDPNTSYTPGLLYKAIK